MEDRKKLSQHDRGSPGDTRSQSVKIHDVDLFIPEKYSH